MSAVQFVVTGDSFAEGRGDPGPGDEFIGWAPRVADLLGISRAGVLNLAGFGATSQDVVDSQLEPAVRAGAPLAAVMVGGNDLVRDYDPDRLYRNLERIVTALAAPGSTTFSMTYPDIPGHLPGIPDDFRAELRKRFAAANDFVRPMFERHGVVYYDMANDPLLENPAVWSPDGIHASPFGYVEIAKEIAGLIGAVSRA